MERMERERITIQKMIEIYCREHHKKDELCEKCGELQSYAEFRLSKCPFQDKKPACQNCTIHCYKPDMKVLVKEVMGKAGPKMIFRHPYLAIMHVGDTFRKAPELKKRKRTSS